MHIHVLYIYIYRCITYIIYIYMYSHIYLQDGINQILHKIQRITVFSHGQTRLMYTFKNTHLYVIRDHRRAISLHGLYVLSSIVEAMHANRFKVCIIIREFMSANTRLRTTEWKSRGRQTPHGLTPNRFSYIVIK